MIASSAETVNPLHPGVTIQQNDDKVESAARALTFGKIGQHRWVANSLGSVSANRNVCRNSNGCAGYDVKQQERYRIRKSNILEELIALGSEPWRNEGSGRRHQSTKIYNFVPSFPSLTTDC